MVAKHILYIEDSLNDQRFVRKVLESHGYALTIATNGEEGIKLARDETPDLILVDIQMPGLDGMATAHLLRQLPDCTATPIVALTAYAEKFERQSYLDVGFTDYQQKQAGIKPLLALVERYMGPAETPPPDAASAPPAAPVSTPPVEPAEPPRIAETPVALETPAKTPEISETASITASDAPHPTGSQGEDASS